MVTMVRRARGLLTEHIRERIERNNEVQAMLAREEQAGVADEHRRLDDEVRLTIPADHLQQGDRLVDYPRKPKVYAVEAITTPDGDIVWVETTDGHPALILDRATLVRITR